MMKQLILIILFLLFTTSIFAQRDKILYYFDEEYKNPETNLYLAGQTVSKAQATRIDNFISMLKDSLNIASLTSKFDVMYLLANETSTLGLRNLVKRSHDITVVNSPTFTQWEGYAGDGTTSYLNTNWNGRTAGHAIAYLLNSASFGIYYRTAIKGAGFDINGAWSSTADGGTANRTQINRPSVTSFTDHSFAINSGAVLTSVFAITGGLLSVSRTNFNLQKAYMNSTEVGSEATVSTKIPNQIMLLGAVFLANMTVSHFDPNQMAFAFIGAGLSGTEVSKLTNCIEWYMDALGTGVIP